VLFLDADDFYCDKNFLFDLSKIIEEKNIDVIVFGNQTYWKGKTGRVVCPISDGKSLAELVLAEEYYIGPWDKVVKRSFLIEKKILFRKEAKYNEDAEWSMLLLAEADTCAVLKKVPYIYRKRPDSISVSVTEEKLFYIKENIEHCVDILQRIEDEKKKEAARVLLADEIAIFLVPLSRQKRRVRKQYDAFIKTNLKYLSYGKRKRDRIFYRLAKILGISVAEWLMGLYMFFNVRFARVFGVTMTAKLFRSGAKKATS
jgi:hypothetical protein